MNTSRLAERWYPLLGISLTALLLGVYARGGLAWPLGFVLLLPWLLALNSARTWRAALLRAWLLSIAFVLAVFGWFGSAIGAYTGSGTWLAIVLLGLLAPLLQPQVLVFALTRHVARRRFGALLGALAGASAWVGCEWLWPKLLGDTLGHGLLPSATLRQVADLGGAAGLTVLLILCNEALTVAVSRWRHGLRGARAFVTPLLLAMLVPASMAGYGVLRLPSLFQKQASDGEPVAKIRIGLVQTAIVDYDRLRAEMGAYEVVRHVLDTHFGMSRAAIEQQGAEVLLWSETVYPTTFGQPQSPDGAALDQEILDFVKSTGVALVFGSYDRDDGGEYNAAAFVTPEGGLLGFYRKTHPFPLTEHVPAWLDSALLRRWLPWTGNWQPGNGARVMPLRTADGRELNVLPLICLDAVHPQLAIDGARLGAQAIISLSNDAWFSAQPLGAHLHLSVAAFRSIETRLPQLRVTSNGLSAIIDPTGEVVVHTQMGDQAILVGAVPIQDPPSTLMLQWGDWVGAAALLFVALLMVVAATLAWRGPRSATVAQITAGTLQPVSSSFEAPVALLTPPWRLCAAALRLLAGAGLLWLGLQMLLRDGLQVNSLAQLKLFAAAVVIPLLANWSIQRVFAATVRIEAGHLLLMQRTRRTEIPLDRLAQLQVWRCPFPSVGFHLVFASGRRWAQAIAIRDPQALLHAINAAGATTGLMEGSQRMADYATLRTATQRAWLDYPRLKFVLFPLLAALPAFRLHQHIAFGGTFGEYYTYGAAAWLSGLLIWWAAWAIGLMLLAAVLRVLIEAGSLLAMGLRSGHALLIRHTLEWSGRFAYYLGVPIWLVLRMLAV